MSAPVVVPVSLGCCPPAGPRCLCCRPSQPVAPETVAALVDHVRETRGHAGALQVWFFGGAPPDDDQLDAIDGLPFGIRVRPDLLSREDAARLHARGLVAVEQDAWTLADLALVEARRPYRSGLVLDQARGLAALGVEVGGVLAPGLPRTDHDRSVRDARQLAPHWSFARIHPLLVIDGSDLAAAHADGRYEPMTWVQAITTCAALLDVFDAHDVAVRRVGQQPGPDAIGRALAGPVHPSLRELVEARRTHRRLHGALARHAGATRVTIRCASEDESRTRGRYNDTLRALRADLSLDEVVVVPDPTLPRGAFALDVDPADPEIPR